MRGCLLTIRWREDIFTAFSQALEANQYGGDVPPLAPDEIPLIFRGSCGIGSRDFRPEHILGAFEYSQGKIGRTDGKTSKDGETFFVLGVEHPYAVKSKSTPSLLPDMAIAVRFHSIGGWGMITTGKNLGSIIGEFGDVISKREPTYDTFGALEDKLFVSANPKYGSEKKGAPTNYYLVVAPKPIRVNCELNHVDVACFVVTPKPLPTPIRWKASNQVVASYGNREIHQKLLGSVFPKRADNL